MKIEHFVITRFNLRTNLWSGDRFGNTLLDDNWMDQRIALFEKFCLPSMINQVNKSFHWLVYFDDSTSDKYRNLIEKYKKICPQFMPLFVNGYDDFSRNHTDDLVSFSKDDTQRIISSRIDNDDCFRKDAIDVIQKELRNRKDGSVINLVNGYCYLIGSDQIVTKYKSPNSPFISVIEDKKNVRSVFYKSHMDFVNDANTSQVEGGPYWLQIIHERNVANNVRGIPQLSLKQLSEFSIKPNQSISILLYIKYLLVYLGGKLLSSKIKLLLLSKIKLK
jgi:hypothetical protein